MTQKERLLLWKKHKDILMQEYKEKCEEERKKKHKKAMKKYISLYRKEWFSILKSKDLTFCRKCGYNKCFAAIDLHHVFGKKEINLATIINRSNPKSKTYKVIKALEELDKCISLCATCHREVHWYNKNEISQEGLCQ